jgi:hypothetical protein
VKALLDFEESARVVEFLLDGPQFAHHLDPFSAYA